MKCKKCNNECTAKTNPLGSDYKSVSNCCSAEIDYTDYSQDKMQGCWHNYPTSGSVTDYPQNMSLRDYFAAKAMSRIPFGEYETVKVAKIAYETADAMLEAREK